MHDELTSADRLTIFRLKPEATEGSRKERYLWWIRILARDGWPCELRAQARVESCPLATRERRRAPEDSRARRRERSEQWWARVESNHRPLACEANALPLSHAPD
jgi:hypothetical protein